MKKLYTLAVFVLIFGPTSFSDAADWRTNHGTADDDKVIRWRS